jgi:hypothetical protein
MDLFNFYARYNHYRPYSDTEPLAFVDTTNYFTFLLALHDVEKPVCDAVIFNYILLKLTKTHKYQH